MPNATVVYSGGLYDALFYALQNSTGWDAPIIGLFNAAYTANFDTVLADLTAIECAFPGYSRVTLGHWNTPGNLGDHIHAYSTNVGYAQFMYTGLTNSGQIYGAFALSSIDGTLLWVDLPLSPPVVLLPHQSYFYTPTAYMRSEF